MFSAKVILDSIGPNGKRLISVEATYPRFIHSEFMTHRDRARNAASSRAIPAAKLRKMVTDDPVIPIRFGREVKGMQQGEGVLSERDQAIAEEIIRKMREMCVAGSAALSKLGLHKSICNRYIEPWMWITVLTTATEWKNFFRLRCHPMAEPHFEKIANMIRDAISASEPTKLPEGAWHTPYVDRMEGTQILDIFGDWDTVKKVSVGRCARLSYLTHDGKRDFKEDIRLCDNLLKPPKDPDESIMHASPFEHVAQASNDPKLRSGPFRGWYQYRKQFVNENLEG